MRRGDSIEINGRTRRGIAISLRVPLNRNVELVAAFFSRFRGLIPYQCLRVGNRGTAALVVLLDAGIHRDPKREISLSQCPASPSTRTVSACLCRVPRPRK